MKHGDKIMVVDGSRVRRASIDSDPIEVTILSSPSDETGSKAMSATWKVRTVGHGLAIGGVISCDEGVRWIRGHHARRSPEVRALLTANALSR